MKKGFTLVELLAVIVILALIMTFAIPSVLKSRNASLEKISEIEVKNIKDAAIVLATDVDTSGNVQNECNKLSLSCTYSADGKSIETINTSVDGLVNLGYYDDSSKNTADKKCSGNIVITASGNGYNVDMSKVECKQ